MRGKCAQIPHSSPKVLFQTSYLAIVEKSVMTSCSPLVGNLIFLSNWLSDHFVIFGALQFHYDTLSLWISFHIGFAFWSEVYCPSAIPKNYLFLLWIFVFPFLFITMFKYNLGLCILSSWCLLTSCAENSLFAIVIFPSPLCSVCCTLTSMSCIDQVSRLWHQGCLASETYQQGTECGRREGGYLFPKLCP